DKATKPQTVQAVRQGEATLYWFLLNHYKNANEKPQYYPRQRQTFHRHSRTSGNPKTKSRRNLTEEPNPENRLPAFA
ncbi:hypothetical protein, partial [Neisseria meningitidis]